MASEKVSQLSPAQCELLQHWQCLSTASGGIARRHDLDAGRLRAHLANITLLDVSAAGRPVIRLAGEAVRRQIGADPRGDGLADWCSELGDWVSLGLQACLGTARPQAGLEAPMPCGRMHAWLRLPLVDEAGEFALVLCHDAWLSVDSETSASDPHSLIHAEEILIAA